MFEKFLNRFKPHQTETDDLNLRYQTDLVRPVTEVYESEKPAKALESDPLNQAERYLLLYKEDSDNPEIPSPEEMNPETRRLFEIFIREFLATQHVAQCQKTNNYVWPSDPVIRETLVATLHTDIRTESEETLQKFYQHEIDEAKSESQDHPDQFTEKRPLSVSDLNDEQKAFLFDAIEDISQADPEVITSSDSKFLEMYSDHLLKKELEASKRFASRDRNPVFSKLERGNILVRPEFYVKAYELARSANRAAA